MDTKERLQALAEVFKVRITYLDETTSTNDVARGEDYEEGDMIFASRQTEGRGQRGNQWASLPGENLTFSIVLKPVFLPADHQFLLSQTISLALVDALEYYGLHAVVKWPNDILVDGKKISGILIENDIKGTNLSRSIVGIGLNVNQKEFLAWVPNAISMSLELGHELDLAQVFEVFYRALSSRYAALLSHYYERLSSDYHSRLWLYNKPHTFTMPDGTAMPGIIRRVEPSGELIVETSDGRMLGFLFKEIIY